MQRNMLAGAMGLAFSGLLAACTPTADQAELGSRDVPLIEVDGLQFRDLDKDGALTPYEDWRLTPQERAEDLVARMTLDEKAGQMVVGGLAGNAPPGEPATGYDLDAVTALVAETGVTHVISRLATGNTALAEANNAVQQVAENGRLGIPAVIMTDPRHGFTELAGASVEGGQFAQFPNGVGIAALDDPAFAETYGALVRGDLRATGFTMLLGPQIDLATEPRWPRNFDTFGEDADISARTAEAFVRGLQGGPDGVEADGVAAIIKHFAGYSASATGFDAHNYYGRHSRLNAEEWEQHIRPFQGALAASPAGVMPAYSILQELELDGAPMEQVGVGYNRYLLNDVLRGELGFEGVILSDWAITRDCSSECVEGHPEGEPPSFATVSTAWGVEDLSEAERFAKGVQAGLDIFGGVDDPSPLVEAVASGLLDEALVDAAVTRVLVQAFELGLFENPFVDPALAETEIGTPDEWAMGLQAQAESMVLLEMEGNAALAEGTRVLLFGVNEEAARAAGLEPVSNAAEADVAVVRTRSPSEMLHPQYIFGSMHQEGSLAFPSDHPALQFMNGLPADLPVIADVQLDRPAILVPFKDRASTLFASFGASDRAFLDVLTGQATPRGSLPFELPSSMAAVEAQRPGAAADSADPLYPLGFRHGGT
ncbi:glycoside hydrolase family 3 protein [Aurantiacibacter gilvus]|uniref:beta-glucosidase n=1 Tax=Aurantiacibacter gilvus TaxID=3139141 RepID=A0ABU9IFE3_9SPHN